MFYKVLRVVGGLIGGFQTIACVGDYLLHTDIGVSTENLGSLNESHV
jgi:hypothetical protein